MLGRALCKAVQKDNTEEALNLLSKEEDISTTVKSGSQGYTALHWAVKNANLELIDALLKKGANPKEAASNKENTTPISLATHLLCDAIDANQTEKASTLSQIRGILTSFRSWDGYPALHCAVKKANFTLIHALLAQDAKPDRMDFSVMSTDGSMESTPISLASDLLCKAIQNNDQAAALKWLNFPELISKDSYRQAFDMAKRNNNITLMRALIIKSDNDLIKLIPEESKNQYDNLVSLESTLFDAVKKTDVSQISCLLEQGVNVSYSELETSNTPLHVASITNNMVILKVLIEAGASMRAKNSEGYTAIDIPFNSSLIKLLCDYFIPDLAKLIIGYSGTDLNLSMHFFFEERQKYLKEYQNSSSIIYRLLQAFKPKKQKQAIEEYKAISAENAAQQHATIQERDENQSSLNSSSMIDQLNDDFVLSQLGLLPPFSTNDPDKPHSRLGLYT